MIIIAATSDRQKRYECNGRSAAEALSRAEWVHWMGESTDNYDFSYTLNNCNSEV